MTLIDLSKLPGFETLFTDPECKLLNRVLMFWNYPAVVSPYWHDRRVMGSMATITMSQSLKRTDLSQAMADCPGSLILVFNRRNKSLEVHPAAVWELCEYLRIRYPQSQVESFIRESRGRFKDFLRDRVKYLTTIEEAINELNFIVFKASLNRLETLQIRALWAVLIFEVGVIQKILDDK